MTITDKQVEAALSAAVKASNNGEFFVTGEDCMRAALEAAEAERMCATHHDITADIVRSCAASGIEADSLDVLMAVERALPVAAPSSAEQAGQDARATSDLGRDTAPQQATPGAPEADERSRFEAAIRAALPGIDLAREATASGPGLYSREAAHYGWAGWQARAKSSAAPSVALVSARDGEQWAKAYEYVTSILPLDPQRQHWVRDPTNPMGLAEQDRHRVDLLIGERDRLSALINTPELHDFAQAVVLEAAHQRERWGSEHDAGKEPADWFWLLGYLSGKALRANLDGDADKAKHHTISSAAALANWHAAIAGTHTAMRPGIEPPAAIDRAIGATPAGAEGGV